MSSDTDTKPGKIFGYEKQVYTGRNSIENFGENVKGILFGPLIWIKGKFRNTIFSDILFIMINHCIYLFL